MKINTSKLIKRRIFPLLLLLGISACGGETPKSTPKKVKETKGQLSLNKATLEQSNGKGQPLWKIEVDQATYSLDRQKVKIENIKGNLFQDGQRVLQISAKEGEVYRNGEEVFLKNNVVAIDPRNGVVINADEMEWQPKQDLLIARKKFTGTHQDLEISATEGRYHSRQEELELVGNILATSRKPRIQLKTEYLKWLIPKHKIVGDRPLEFIRYQDNLITDQLKANSIDINTKEKSVFSQGPFTFKSVNPAVQLVGSHVLWNYRDRNLQSQQTTQVVDYKEQVTLTGNQVYYDQVKKYVGLGGGVQGKSTGNQTEIYSQQALWNIANKTIEATGNVTYKQQNPRMHLTGDRAIGIIQENQVIVTSDSEKRVVTEIYPQKQN